MAPVGPVPPENNPFERKLTCVDDGMEVVTAHVAATDRGERRPHTPASLATRKQERGGGVWVRGTEPWVLAEFGSVTMATAWDGRWPFVNGPSVSLNR